MEEGEARARSEPTDQQLVRLRQLEGLSAEELDRLMRAMTEADSISHRSDHFRRHGTEVGATTEEAYEHLFLQHLNKGDLRRFTFLRTQNGEAMWYLINQDSGDIAMYNGTQRRHWSFFRNKNIQRMLDGFREKAIEATLANDGWIFEPWL